MKYINPNPLNKFIGDCVVRAISTVLDISWDEAYLGLVLRGYVMKDMPSSNAVWDAELISQGFNRETLPYRPDYTVKDFCREHKYGTFVLGTGTHALAVIDGDYYDAWDSGNEIPTYYYRKEF